MGQHVSRTDFEHTYTEEPHASRRKLIMQKHPEVRQLIGPDPWLAVWVILLVIFQILSLFVIQNVSWPVTILCAYFIGGTINHILLISLHDIAHNLAFGYKYAFSNRILGYIANLPIGVPASVTFKNYHLDHHKFQGVKIMDPDIPTALEASLFCTTFGKTIWVLLLPFFYSFRPMIMNCKPPTALEVANTAIQIAFDFAVCHYIGYKALAYLVLGTILSMGLHPLGGHLISEHYMFSKGQETYSYYGPLNRIAFNIGYHNEHHDFPFMASSKLPQLRAMAPEFYDTLPYHTSLIKVIYEFIMDPSIGPYARMVRERNFGRSAKPMDLCAEMYKQTLSASCNGQIGVTSNGDAHKHE